MNAKFQPAGRKSSSGSTRTCSGMMLLSTALVVAAMALSLHVINNSICVRTLLRARNNSRNATTTAVVHQTTHHAQPSTQPKLFRCSLQDYLKGTWQPTDTPQVRPGYSFCKVDVRQDCRAYATAHPEYLLKTWVPDDERCALKHLSAPQIKQCLTRQKLVFWGDSLARNQHHSFQCMMMERAEENVKMVDGYKMAWVSDYPETHTRVRQEGSLHVRAKELAKIANDTIVVVGTGPHWLPVTLGLLEPKNGSNYRTWNEYPGGIPAAKAVVTSMIKETIEALLTLPASTKIIWRTPDLSHSPTQHNPWRYDCAALVAAWDPAVAQKRMWDDATRWIHEAVVEYASGTRIQVMNVLAMSGMRFDAHPSSHLNLTSKRDGKPTSDCLHWCLPGVPDTWNDVLVNWMCDDVGGGAGGGV